MQLSVTASGARGAAPDITPTSDVLGNPDMDSEAEKAISSIEAHPSKETAVAVLKDGTHVAPDSCTNDGCTFTVDMAQVKFVVHRHVNSDSSNNRLARITNEMREMRGPGDHLFPSRASAPNYFETPSGAFRVLEYTDEAWRVRTISGDAIPTNWHPRDARARVRRR